MKILFTPVMKDGKQEVRAPQMDEWIGDKGGYYPYNPDIEMNGFSYPIYTRTETNMKTPDEVREFILELEKRRREANDEMDIDTVNDIQAELNILAWVLGEEEK